MIIYTGDAYYCKTDLISKGFKFRELWEGITLLGLDWHISEDEILDRPGALLSEDYLYELGKALCKTPNIKLFTHNNILILGVRVGVKNGVIPAKDVDIVFYSGTNECHVIKIEEDGSISNWPDGFDSAIDKAFRELFRC